MNEMVRAMMKEYPIETTDDAINAIREIMQQITLLGLWRTSFFKKAAFYGGTALRIIFNLQRYSEDLDFSLLSPDIPFSWIDYESGIRSELAHFGFNVEVEQRSKQKQSPIETAFIKAGTLQHLLSVELAPEYTFGINKHQNIKVKIEIDTDPPGNFRTEQATISTPIPFPVEVYSLPDLFAGKMHAVLCRSWKNRVKGRDWFDMAWYIGRRTPLHLGHLKERMVQSGHWEERVPFNDKIFYDLLSEKIATLDIEQAKGDVLPFLKDRRDREVVEKTWSQQFFQSMAPMFSFLEGIPH